MFQKDFAVASTFEAPGPVASNNLRLRCGFAGDDVRRALLLLGEGLLATFLSFSELTRLGRLNHSFQRLHDASWRAIWRARSKTCGGEELARILCLSVTLGKAEHVRELVRPMTPKTPIPLPFTPIKKNLPNPSRGSGRRGGAQPVPRLRRGSRATRPCFCKPSTTSRRSCSSP
jgi:hypothetical protein